MTSAVLTRQTHILRGMTHFMSDNPLMGLFASRTMVRLLTVFLANPDASYYQQELVELSGGTLRPVQLALDKLEEADLVRKQRRGKQVFYQVVASHPAYPALKTLFERTFALADVLRDALEPLGSGILAAFVYGSVAAAQERASSDVDVLIVGDVDRRGVATALARSDTRLSREVNTSLYSPDRFADMVRLQDHFLLDVLAGPKIWLVGDESVLERLAG